MIRRLVFLWMAFYSFQVLAFGQTGHRITGEIAEKYLTENTRLAIAELLDNESLAEVSTYVDEMRSDPDDFWQKVATPYHYVTVPKDKTYDEIGSPIQGDAMFALKKYSQIVRDPLTSKSEKSLAIKFIVHLIGDLHQPLHVGTGLDRGGNDFKVKFFGQRKNLHSVWDSGLIDGKQLSFSEWSNWLSQKISEEDLVLWNEIDPLVWIKESIEIRNTIYPITPPILVKKSTEISKKIQPELPSIGYKYSHQHLPTLKLRLKQAGVRIAAYLNDLMKNKK